MGHVSNPSAMARSLMSSQRGSSMNAAGSTPASMSSWKKARSSTSISEVSSFASSTSGRSTEVGDSDSGWALRRPLRTIRTPRWLALVGAERWARTPVGDWAAAGRPPVPGACPQPARSHWSHRPPPQVGVVLWPWAVQVVQVQAVPVFPNVQHRALPLAVVPFQRRLAGEG